MTIPLTATPVIVARLRTAGQSVRVRVCPVCKRKRLCVCVGGLATVCVGCWFRVHETIYRQMYPQRRDCLILDRE